MAKKQFKAESKRLLDLMINSIYTHKEIFLREIISNASDACDKLCYQALTDDSVGMSRKDFKIEIKADKEHRTLTVSDNGIGMDREDLENNLGVIASSGSYQVQAGGGGRRQGHRRHRPVRRGLLLRLHGGGPHHRGDAEVRRRHRLDVAVRRGRRLHHHRVRAGQRGHGHHHAHQAGHRRREIQRVPGVLAAPGAGAQVLRLHPLPHPDGGLQDPPEGGQPRRQARVRDVHGGGDPELHGAHLAAAQVQREAGGVQQVLPGQVPRLHRPPEGHRRVRRGRRHLQGAAVHPRRRPLRLLHQGVREGPPAVLQRRAHHGQVRRPAAGALPVRPGRGGLPGPEPEHLPGAAAARPAAEGHRRQPGEEDQERACQDAQGRPGGL